MKPNIERSAKWPAVEKAHIAAHPQCLCCVFPGAPVQVHHIIPVHFARALGRPDLELDPRNLVTLCEAEEGKPAEDHHLLVGHLGDFHQANLQVLDDVETFKGDTGTEIRGDNRWNDRVRMDRVHDVTDLSDLEQEQLRQIMDTRFPLAPVLPKPEAVK